MPIPVLLIGVHPASPGNDVVPGGHALHAIMPSMLRSGYEPAGHFMLLPVLLIGVHCEAPGDDVVPGGQGAHDAFPAGANVPAAQGMHALTEVFPVTGLNVPAGQFTQLLPNILLAIYWPTGQVLTVGLVIRMHCDAPADDVVPGGQGAQNAFPAGEYVPAAHFRHALTEVAPGVGLNVPVGQGTQVLRVWPNFVVLRVRY